MIIRLNFSTSQQLNSSTAQQPQPFNNLNNLNHSTISTAHMDRRKALKTTALFLGYAVSASALSELFVSCSTSNHLNWKPEFLTADQARTIGDMAERILPRTKTPGAKDLHIDKFIDKMLKDLLAPEEQQDFVAGLAAFEASCIQQYGKKFAACSAAQQTDLLLKMDKAAAKLPPSLWGIRLAAASPNDFFRRVKELTLLGYYTSEAIGKNVLSYDPLPGVYVGCMPVSEVGNAWNE